MPCVVAQRNRCRDLKHDLAALDVVAHVDVLAPHQGVRREWTVSAVVVGDAVPAAVTSAIARHDMDLLPAATGPRGEPPHVEVVCRV
jgi:hypothetical protein